MKLEPIEILIPALLTAIFAKAKLSSSSAPPPSSPSNEKSPKQISGLLFQVEVTTGMKAGVWFPVNEYNSVERGLLIYSLSELTTW